MKEGNFTISLQLSRTRGRGKWLYPVIIVLFMLFFSVSLDAQLLTPLNNEMNRLVEYEMTTRGFSYFTVIKPFYDSQLSGPVKQDSLQFPFLADPHPFTHHSWFRRKLNYESFVQVDSGSFYLFADPAFELNVGKDNSGRKTYVNTRGFRAGGRLGKSFAFGTDFYENQAVFNTVLDAAFRISKIIPGQGRGRITGNVWDYSHSSGYLSFSPVEKLNLQLGMGKTFIGDGYRSLLLSDVSYNYPYGRATWLTKNWMYSWAVIQTQNLGIVHDLNDKEPYKREMLSVHLLAFNLTRFVQFSFIQGTLFNNPDTFGTFRPGFDEFNPVIMPVFNKEKVHSLWGINLKINIGRYLKIYHQLVADNLFGKGNNRLALQAGFKYFDVFGLKGLYAQAEYNRIDPYMYTSAERPLQWMHYGEPLAHPYGHNIEEGVADVAYAFRRWELENQMDAVRPLKDLSVYPQVIKPALPYYITGQKRLSNDLRLTYYLNAKTLMHFTLGFVYQKETLPAKNTSLKYVYFAFRTSLQNVY